MYFFYLIFFKVFLLSVLSAVCSAESDPELLARTEHVSPLVGGGSVSHHSNTLEDGRSVVTRHHTQTSNPGLRAFLNPQGQLVDPGFGQRTIIENSPALFQDQHFFVNNNPGLLQARQQPFIIQSPSLFDNQAFQTNSPVLFQQQVLQHPFINTGAPDLIPQQLSNSPSLLQHTQTCSSPSRLNPRKGFLYPPPPPP